MVQPRLRDADDSDETPFDSRTAKNYLQYARGSIRRRRVLASSAFLLVLLGALAALFALPKSYHVEAKLLAHTNAGLSVRGDSTGTDAPTKAAAEMVLRHDNLVAMVEATDLIEHYAGHMAPAQRVRAFFAAMLRPDRTRQDEIEDMVELLAKQFHVWSNDGTVTIAIDWPDARMAYRLVDYAQESFLEARHVHEVASTAESVGILRGHAAAMRRDVDTAVEALQRVAGGLAGAARGQGVHSEHAVASTRSPPSLSAERQAELTKLRATIEAKRRAADDLEDVRRHRLTELRARLLEQRAVYTENHPTIIDLEQTIAFMSKDSPQAASLRKEAAALSAQLDGKGFTDTDRGSSPAALPDVPALPPQLPADVLSFERSSPEDRDPAMVYARGQLRDAMEKYAAFRSQIQTAQIDLETAEAAFKYRYAVVTPAQVPKRPAKPSALWVVLGAMAAGVFVGLLAAVLADVQSGRVFERWQLELVLGKPVLGVVGSRTLPPRS